MVFKEKSVLERLKKLEEVLARLKERKEMTLEEYRKDTTAQWVVERGLEIASSTILDIGNHILAGVYSTSAEEYEEILEKLKEREVISEELYKKLQGLGGFRNILVHGYLSLDPVLVYEHYKKAHYTFPHFIAEIEKWLERYKRGE